MKLRGIELALLEAEDVCSVIRKSHDFYEAEILDALRARRPQESGIVDIGSHIGNHSAYWCAFASPAWLVAFEPQPDLCKMTARNLERWPVATVHCTALSDFQGTIRMRPDPTNRGRTMVDPEGSLVVPVTRLDDILLPGCPSFMKIDVESHQAYVLRGAAVTLRSCRPALLVEDGEGIVGATLMELGLEGYRKIAEYHGANDLWEWQ